MRTYTPIDTTVPRRFNPPRTYPSPTPPPPPQTLQGEGLRPGENRDRALTEDEMEPGSENAQPTSLPDALQRFIPTRDFPNPPNMPYSPFPYTPF